MWNIITTLKRLIWKVTKWTLATFGVLLVCLLLLMGGAYAYYEWIWQEWSPARIERITGVRIPAYKTIEYNEGLRGFNGDFDDWFTIEFKTMPSDEMFDEIERMIETGKTGWHKEGNEYIFNCTWGNGFKAPNGESDDEDRIFGITITRGEKQGIIRHGMW